jgi:hypothetical protein
VVRYAGATLYVRAEASGVRQPSSSIP